MGQRHTLLVTSMGETVTASVDGQAVGQFTSPGLAHPTKRVLRIAVPHSAVGDDVKIWVKNQVVD